jgi:hypothetical protein
VFVELVCGKCESSLQLDSEEEDPTWLVVHRFANAHAECGFMTPSHLDPEFSGGVKVIKPRISEDPEGS